MRSIIISLVMLTVPLAAVAEYNDSPLIVVGEKTTPQAEKADAATTADTTTGKESASKPVAAKPTPANAQLPPNFPDWAISKAGETTGNQPDAAPPATPASPAAPQAAPAASAPQSPDHPAAPATPESPVNKLWPRDTVPIFVQSCVGLNISLVPACTCVITKLMVAMPHDEFLELSANNKINSDPRYVTARQDCATAPARKE